MALAGGAGLAIGLALVSTTINKPPPGYAGRMETEAPPPKSAHSEDAPNPSVQIAAEAAAATNAPGATVEAAETTDLDDADEETVDEPIDVPTTPRVAQRVRVAYIRCGNEQPCPRDREFEEAAWEAIANLPNCPHAPRLPGTGDVRLHRRGAVNELRFRDWGDSPLPIPPLQACLAPSLRNLPTRLRLDPLVVSFRFQYE